MMKDGLFEKFPMEAIFGAHNWPGMAVGPVRAERRTGVRVEQRVQDHHPRQGRARARCRTTASTRCRSACQMVQAFQTIISRNKRPIDTGVISVTMIHTGEATNVDPRQLRDRGHGAHLHHRGARPDRAAHEDDRREHLRGVRMRLRVRVHAQLPADDQPHGRDRVRAQRCSADVVGADNVHDFEPTMGAEDFSYFLHGKPGCYFLIGNGDGAHRAGGHGMGPCMLHNPSYDFNDDLIPLGATVWVRLAEALAGAPR